MSINYECDCPSGGRCYVKEHMPDWEILDGCFPPRVRPTDVDGAVELNGHVLFFEWKGLEARFPDGQRYMYLAMTRDAPKQRVLVIFGNKGDPKRVVIFSGGKSELQQCDINWLRDYCKSWTVMTQATVKAIA